MSETTRQFGRGAAWLLLVSALAAAAVGWRGLGGRAGFGGHSPYLSAAIPRMRAQWEREREIDYPKLVRGNPALREVALTFDDGPHPGRTERLLAILRREGVRATFFVVGKMVDRNPELVQREVAEGHEVASHTYDHLRLPLLPVESAERELREGSEAVARAVGSPTRLYRPPGGEYNQEILQLTKEMGLVMVLWTADPKDFMNPGTAVLEQRLQHDIANGGIVLLHDGIEQTMQILPGLIRRLKSEGYRFVTVTEMARQKGVVKIGGPKILPSDPMLYPTYPKGPRI